MNMIANDNRLRRQEIMLRLLDYEIDGLPDASKTGTNSGG